MNCDGLERILIEGDPSRTSLMPSEVQEHLTRCPRCNELFKALQTGGDDEKPAPAMLGGIAKELGANLWPKRPLASPRFYVSVFAAIFALIVAFGVSQVGAFALSAMTAVQRVSILATLGICVLLLEWSLVRQMVPGSRHWFRPEFLPAAVILVLSLVMAVLFRFRQQTGFWLQGWACLRTGFPFALLAAAPFWLVLRRGVILSPRTAGAATGLLAGLVGTGVLEIHCPNLDLSHILVWHLGVSILSALGGLAVGTAGEFLGGYLRNHRARRRAISGRM